MKKIILLSVLSFYTCFLMQGQVIHSSNNLGISFGVEGFSTFSPRMPEFTLTGESSGVFGEKPIEGKLRWRPVCSINYRKILNSGNYFGLSATFGRTNWLEGDIDLPFQITGQPSAITFTEQSKERTIGLGYTYSFLITKRRTNLQFFIGAESSLYYDFAENKPIELVPAVPNSVFITGPAQRNILGIRVSLIPELMYLFPNSRLTASFRVKLPLIHFERNAQNTLRAPTSSFFGGSSVHYSSYLLGLNRSRIEFGIGYFLFVK